MILNLFLYDIILYDIKDIICVELHYVKNKPKTLKALSWSVIASVDQQWLL